MWLVDRDCKLPVLVEMRVYCNCKMDISGQLTVRILVTKEGFILFVQFLPSKQNYCLYFSIKAGIQYKLNKLLLLCEEDFYFLFLFFHHLLSLGLILHNT